jgi:hypothetical protein
VSLRKTFGPNFIKLKNQKESKNKIYGDVDKRKQILDSVIQKNIGGIFHDILTSC